MKKFIPVWEYCKKHNISKQTIYRWIRERKIDNEFRIIEKSVKRIMINEDFIPFNK